MAETTMDPDAVKTFYDDWAEDLGDAAKALGVSSLTITAATVEVDGGAEVVAHTVLNSGVIFKLAAPGLTGNITTKTTVTLSNGDTDLRRHLIRIRPT